VVAVLNFGARIGAASLHKLIAAAAQRTRLRVSDVSIRYSQGGAPGPRPGLEGRLAGADAAQLTVRDLRLEPAGASAWSWGMVRIVHVYMYMVCYHCQQP